MKKIINIFKYNIIFQTKSMLTEVFWRWGERTGQDRREKGLVSKRSLLKNSKYQGILSYPFTDSKSTLLILFILVAHEHTSLLLLFFIKVTFRLQIMTGSTDIFLPFLDVNILFDFEGNAPTSQSLQNLVPLHWHCLWTCTEKKSSRFRLNQMRWCTFVSKALFNILY